MHRTMLASSIEELEIAFQRKGDDISFVEKLLYELNHRSTKRARTLKALATRAYQARIAASEQSESEGAGGDEPEFLRGAKLTLHVAQAPLSEGDRGVAILSNDVLHETTFAGSESKEMVNYILVSLMFPPCPNLTKEPRRLI
jgi:hypothetical protein